MNRNRVVDADQVHLNLFGESSSGLVELVNFPGEDSKFGHEEHEFKIVQLYVMKNVIETPYLLFETQDLLMYKDTLTNFLDLNKIAYEKITPPNFKKLMGEEYEIPDDEKIPSLVGDGYKVVGAGLVGLELSKKIYHGISGKSGAYLIEIYPNHKAISEKSLELKGFECFDPNS